LWQKFLRDFLVLFATIDPIVALMIFATVTRKLKQNERARIASRAVVYAGVILIGSALLGQFILIGMGISMVSFQVAGGIVLFLFSLQMIFGTLHHTFSTQMKRGGDIAIYPLAIPTIASPGTILAMILLTDNHLFPVQTQIGTVLIAILILILTYILFRLSGPILERIGEPGADLIVRIMGLLLAALSVQFVFDALLTGQIGH
jgi:multiple antibiotic resistance protein